MFVYTRLRDTRRRGVVMVLVAGSMVTLLLCAALAIDVGHMCVVAAQQQINADAGALAGASGLQDDDPYTAFDRAIEFISANQELQGRHSLEDQTIEFGWFDSVSNTFHVIDDHENAFAVRVGATYTDMPFFFAGILGRNSTDVPRDAVAIGTKPCGGIWGLEGVRIPGNVLTDSYNSTEGLYDVGTAGDGGDVCSGRGIRVMGSIELHGDAMAGLGYEVESRGGPIITGVTTATLDGAGLTAPTVHFGDVDVNNDNDTIGLTDGGIDPFTSGLNISIQASDNLTLAPGTYLFDSVSFSSDATLTVTGPTTIYMTGDFDASGDGTVNSTQNPADLTILSTGLTIKMTGSVAFYGSILAPNADVSVGGTADFYGALIGKTVKMHGDFEFHVDESLPLAQPWYTPPLPFLVL